MDRWTDGWDRRAERCKGRRGGWRGGWLSRWRLDERIRMERGGGGRQGTRGRRGGGVTRWGWQDSDRGQGPVPACRTHQVTPRVARRCHCCRGPLLWGAGTGTPAEQPVRDGGQGPPAGSALLGLPQTVGHRLGVPHVPRVLQRVLVGWGLWSPPLRGSGDKGTWGHLHPSQAFRRVGILGGLRLGPPKANSRCREHHGHRGAPQKSPAAPKTGGAEQQGKGKG